MRLGVSFAAAAVTFKSMEMWVRRVAGLVLIGVGFYFLGTF